MTKYFTKLGKRLSTKVLMAAALVGLGGSFANAALQLQYDLELGTSGGGSKAGVVKPGTPVSLGLFALVADTANGNGSFISGAGNWVTTGNTGTMNGNLSTTLAPGADPLSGGQSVCPTPVDLNGDGYKDIGWAAGLGIGTAVTTDDAYSAGLLWVSTGNGGSAFTTADFGTKVIGGVTYHKYLIGTGTFTPGTITSGQAVSIGFSPTVFATTPGHQYNYDGIARSRKNLTTQDYVQSDGLAVTLTGGSNHTLSLQSSVTSPTKTITVTQTGPGNYESGVADFGAGTTSGSVGINMGAGSLNSVPVYVLMHLSNTNVADAVSGSNTFSTNVSAWDAQFGAGTFNAVAYFPSGLPTVGGLSFDFGGDSLVTKLAVVPEPATLSLLGLGALGLLARRRRA